MKLKTPIVLLFIAAFSQTISGCFGPAPVNRQALHAAVTQSSIQNTWVYEEIVDRIRNTVNYSACTQSERNELGLSLGMCILIDSENHRRLVFSAPSGNIFHADPQSGVVVTSRFDQQEVEEPRLHISPSMTGLVSYVDGPFMRNFGHSTRTLIIELPIYRMGRMQFTFNGMNILSPEFSRTE